MVDETRQQQTAQRSGHDAADRDGRALTQNAAKQVMWCGADGEPHAELTRARADRERQHARDADEGDRQRHERKSAEHHRIQPVRRERLRA
jgi:hypothetical protein